MPTWMTVDTDDLRHLPKHQGHPTRSIQSFAGPSDELSPDFRQGWAGFVDWMASHQGAVTLFVITDLLENSDFASTLQHALEAFSDRLTVGCHGHTHRSWSAWGEDVEGFRTMLQTSTTSLKTHAGPAFRPYFRAPNGYIAPWMAPVLAEAGYLVETSVNPSWLVKSKAGGSTWKSVAEAMEEAGVTERPWLTRRTLPVNGPALFKFPLSLNAKSAWRRAPPLLTADQLKHVEDPKETITTLYCHVLDFARNAGTWRPPL